MVDCLSRLWLCSAVLMLGMIDAAGADPISGGGADTGKAAASAVSATQPAGCSPEAGGYATDGTQSWVPTCSGSWLGARTDDLPTMAVIGVPSRRPQPPFAPDMANVGTAQALIQAIARADGGAETALSINFDVAQGGGHTSGSHQKVGLSTFVRAHPGPGGSRPGDTWAFNPDIQVARGSGALLAINSEFDFNNFDDGCDKPGCFMVMQWHNYLSSFPITADTYVSGDTDKHQGTADIVGARLTATAGPPFTADTTTIAIAGRLVRVDKVVDDHTLTLVSDLGRLAHVATMWQPHMVHTGFLISGDNAVADSDFSSSSSGYYGLYLNGHHNVLFAAAGDAAPYAFVSRPGQATCFDGVDGCLLYEANGRLQYQDKGNPAVQVEGISATQGVDFALIRNAPAGRGPSITVDGASPSAPLNLSGKGGAPVAVVGSPLKLPVYTIAALPRCEAGALGEAVYVSDTSAKGAATWHGPVLGGGATRVRSVAACNGEVWQYE